MLFTHSSLKALNIRCMQSTTFGSDHWKWVKLKRAFTVTFDQLNESSLNESSDLVNYSVSHSRLSFEADVRAVHRYTTARTAALAWKCPQSCYSISRSDSKVLPAWAGLILVEPVRCQGQMEVEPDIHSQRHSPNTDPRENRLHVGHMSSATDTTVVFHLQMT